MMKNVRWDRKRLFTWAGPLEHFYCLITPTVPKQQNYGKTTSDLAKVWLCTKISSVRNMLADLFTPDKYLEYFNQQKSVTSDQKV